MKRKVATKWMTGVATMTLGLQAVFPLMGEAMENSHVNILEETSPVISKELSQWNFQAMKAQIAWNEGFTGKGVKVAIVDTGISDHPDLKIAGGVSTVDGESSYEDEHGHGTHVAGIINAQHNQIGMVGIAPDAEIYAVKALKGKDSGVLADVVEGIQWAIDNNMDIINLSVGVNEDYAPLRDIIKKAHENGILIVSSTGNAGSNTSVTYPAKYPEVIAVSAVDQSKEQADFSAKGSEVNFSAPGVDIISTYLNDQYALISGTSQATPHVVGLLALLKEKYPSKSNAELTQELQAMVEDLGAEGKDDIHGFGFALFQDSQTAPSPVEEVEEVEEEPVLTIQEQRYVRYAERYIGYVEQYRRTTFVSTAQMYIDKLPESQKKDELNNQLEKAVEDIKGTSTSKSTATTQPSDTSTTTSTPETSNTLSETQKRNVEMYLSYAEKYNMNYYKERSKQLIDALPECDETITYQKRYNALMGSEVYKIEVVAESEPPVDSSTPVSSNEEASTPVENEEVVEGESSTETVENNEPVQSEEVSDLQRKIVNLYLTYAERYKSSFYLNQTKIKIDALPECAEKEYYKQRLDAIQ